MFDDSPSDGETVKSGGASTDFVEQDETGRGGVGENAGDFAHFDEESGTAAREIVAGANASEDTVGERKFRLASGNERTALRHQNDQTGLPQVGGLAAHVGSGEQETCRAGREIVARDNASEDRVGERKFRLASGNERTDLRQRQS